MECMTSEDDLPTNETIQALYIVFTVPMCTPIQTHWDKERTLSGYIM
jgi:hypothetical protein